MRDILGGSWLSLDGLAGTFRNLYKEIELTLLESVLGSVTW